VEQQEQQEDEGALVLAQEEEEDGMSSQTSSSNKTSAAATTATTGSLSRSGAGSMGDDHPIGSNPEDHLRGRGWRTLQDPSKASEIVPTVRRAHPLRCDEYGNSVLDTVGKTCFAGIWLASQRTEYVPTQFSIPVTVMGVSDITDEITRTTDLQQKNQSLEDELKHEMSLKEIIEAFEVNGLPNADGQVNKLPTGFTSADRAFAARDDPGPTIEDSIKKAFTAVRNMDLGVLEEMVEAEGVPLDSTDSYGCTLLHVAAQQGSKRLVKYLLRKKAPKDTQSLLGNTALHYAFEYGHPDLGEYMISKGANYELANVQGCTCYEGLSRKDVDDI